MLLCFIAKLDPEVSTGAVTWLSHSDLTKGRRVGDLHRLLFGVKQQMGEAHGLLRIVQGHANIPHLGRT